MDLIKSLKYIFLKNLSFNYAVQLIDYCLNLVISNYYTLIIYDNLIIILILITIL